MEHEYFKTDQQTVTDLSDFNISELYSKGYVFTRINRGLFNQTRSLRVKLNNWQLNSENRRVLKKSGNLKLRFINLPLNDYNWQIHKLGKDFYSAKFGDNTMSASKIKEMFVDSDKSNFNACFEYSLDNKVVGYCLLYVNESIIHYAYPFYNLEIPKENNLGMAMIIQAIQWAQTNKKEFIYLGSVTDSKSAYKLQFNNLEWFNTEQKVWSSNIEELKAIIK